MTDALAVRGLCMRFAATVALDHVDLTVRAGSVHALLGGNGSGKSTAVKILAGVFPADDGTIEVKGESWGAEHYTARKGRDAGLRFVHQDLGVFDQLSIAENFALDAGYPTAPGARIRWAALRRRVAGLLATYEIDADPDAPLGSLRPAERTMVAIARALQDQEGDELILVLDEPTASLAQHESAILLEAVRRRADRGQTVVLVSHRMPEVLAVANDFTVLRDGRTAGTLRAASPTEDELIALMTGKELGRTMVATAAAGPVDGAGTREVLRVSGLAGGPLRGVDLSVGAGEIVGVAGLVGSGRTTLLKTLFGQHVPVAGSATLDGAPHASRSAARAVAKGVAYVPEDRGGEAAFADLTVRDNLSASVFGRYFKGWGMAYGRERQDARRLIDEHAVRVAGTEATFASMSGGNQQKVILARWLRRSPRLLLLDEPTQGVDVMSRAEIYRTIRDTASGGCAVVVASSDFVELAALCDRVVVLKDGRIARQISGADLTADLLTAAVQSSGDAPGDEVASGEEKGNSA